MNRDFFDIHNVFNMALHNCSTSQGEELALLQRLIAIRDMDNDIYAVRDALLSIGVLAEGKYSHCKSFLDLLSAVPRTLAPVEFHYACRNALRGSPFLPFFLFVLRGFESTYVAAP